MTGETTRTCQHCSTELPRASRHCPHCGAHVNTCQRPESDLPAYHRRRRRFIGITRCGLFHHELMANLFRYRFCPECGQQLILPQLQPGIQ